MSMQLREGKQQQQGGLAGVWRDRIAAGELGLLPVMLALVVIWIIFQSVNSHFLSGRNMSNLILQIAEIGMLGIGETFILLLGEIDLSIAAVSGVAAAVLVLMSGAHVNPWLCILAAVVVGAVIGVFQGFWVTIIGVPAFIVTLAGSLGYQGILLAFLGNTGTVPIFNQTLLNIAASYVPGWLGWALVVVAVAGYAAGLIGIQQGLRKRNLSAMSARSMTWRLVLLGVVSVVVVGALNSYRGVPVAGLILLVFVVLFAYITQEIGRAHV